MLKRIASIVTWSLAKKSAKWSMVLIGSISTIMTVVGVSLGDLLPWDFEWPLRLLVLAVAFILLAVFAAVVAYLHSKDGIHLMINGMDVDVVVGDLFKCDGVKVIPFDEYFDTEVDDKVISKNSLNGIFVTGLSDLDLNSLRQIVREVQPSLMGAPEKENGRLRYPLGTVKRYEDYALLAFTHMDEQNRAHLRRGQYEECLHNMWDELDCMYSGRRVVLPLLGSGITRFEGGKPSEDDLLRCMLCTLRASKHHFKDGITIVLTAKTASRMRLYEVDGYIRAWDKEIGEKDGL